MNNIIKSLSDLSIVLPEPTKPVANYSPYVIFKNTINPENNFNHNLSRFRDYDSGTNIVEIEQELIDEITKEIIEDIFIKSVVNW